MVVIRTSLFINCSTGLDYKTEKGKKKNGKCVRICSKFSVKCEASHNNKSRRFYAVRADTEQEETVK